MFTSNILQNFKQKTHEALHFHFFNVLQDYIHDVIFLYQSIPAVNIPLGRPPGNFLEGQNPHPQAKKAARPQSPGQKFMCEKALKPHPRDRTRLKKLIKDICSKGTEMYLNWELV